MERVLAQKLTIGQDNFSVSGPLKFQSLADVIGAIIPYIFGVAGVGVLIMVILSGITLMTSAGDAKKMEQGKTQLTYAIVGFIIIFAAFWIVQFAGYAFGIQSIIDTFQ